MLNVLITVDTEIWPDSPGWPQTPLASDADCGRELSAYFDGGDGEDGPGIRWQLGQLEAAGLKATYFVDPLFSFSLGLEPLERVVRLVQSRRQEIGLHIHPEWLSDPRCPGLPPFRGPYLADFSENEQGAIVNAAISRLREAGATNIRSFRAGSWSASSATLRALHRNGIDFDASLNPCFAPSYPGLEHRASYNQPVRSEGVWMIPVTTFVDRPPRGLRPLHVCACSFDEMRAVLEHAAVERWFAVVIVLHSFEFVRVAHLANGGRVSSHRLLMQRFERLCDFLGANRARFSSCHFADLDKDGGTPAREPLISTRRRTLSRVVQQIASRIY